MKRTGFEYFNELRPVVEENFNTTDLRLAELRNLSAIFPDNYAYADACSGISLLQVSDLWLAMKVLGWLTV